MEETALWIICLNAFIAVMALLGLLAGALRALTLLFPEKADTSPDPVWAAAITHAVAAQWPGARVTRIEEQKGKSRHDPH